MKLSIDDPPKASQRQRAIAWLRTHPRLFDITKKVSRVAGATNRVYEFLKDFTLQYPRCKFLQIGSNDGLMVDPLREFIVWNDWNGILVEPVPRVFECLKKNYRHLTGLQFVNVAISDSVGSLRIWSIREDALKQLPPWVAGINSLDREHVLNCFEDPEEIEPFLESFDVPCQTVEQLLNRHKLTQVDLIHIDAEGAESKILRAIDFSVVNPAVIIFEYRHLDDKQELYTFLIRHGYAVYEIAEEWDAIAVRRDQEIGWCDCHKDIRISNEGNSSAVCRGGLGKERELAGGGVATQGVGDGLAGVATAELEGAVHAHHHRLGRGTALGSVALAVLPQDHRGADLALGAVVLP